MRSITKRLLLLCAVLSSIVMTTAIVVSTLSAQSDPLLVINNPGSDGSYAPTVSEEVDLSIAESAVWLSLIHI